MSWTEIFLLVVVVISYWVGAHRKFWKDTEPLEAQINKLKNDLMHAGEQRRAERECENRHAHGLAGTIVELRDELRDLKADDTPQSLRKRLNDMGFSVTLGEIT